MSALTAPIIILIFVCLSFKGRERLSLPAIMLILALMVVSLGLFMPSLGKARGSNGEGVEVLDRSIIGGITVSCG